MTNEAAAVPDAVEIRKLLGTLDPDTYPEPQATEIRDLINQVTALLARPIPDVTHNGSYTVRAVIDGHPAEPGLLRSWYVACEDTSRNAWVTWEAYALDGSQTGKLGYNGGHYFEGPDTNASKRHALADLAVRAGAKNAVAEIIADEITGWTYAPQEDRRMAARLRKYAAS